MKMGQPGVPKIGEYLETALAEGETVGFDGRVVSVTEGEEYEKIASEKNGKVVYAYDLIDEVWEDRPILSEEPVFELEQKYTGETVESKLARTRAAMKEADVYKRQALVSGLSNYTMLPVTFKAVISEKEIVNKEKLMNLLAFNKEDLKLMKQMNYLTIQNMR